MRNKSKNVSTGSVSLSRVSHTSQDTEGYSLPAQQKLLNEYAERKGFSLTKKFTITETASKSAQRRTFTEMMTYVEGHCVKRLLVEKVDRLVRNFKDTVMIDDWLEADEERQVHFVKDNLILHKNARSQEKLNWGMRVVIAKNYIDNLREEVDKGVKEKLAQGWLPGVPPLGYKTIGLEGKRIHIIDDDIAPLIQQLFEIYLDPEHSLSTVTIKMAELGLRSRKGRSLSRSHITKLLTHQFYIGKVPWSGQVYPGSQTQLISDELFGAVQCKLHRRGSPRYQVHNPLFKGLISCKECGCRITWEKQKERWYGRCKGRQPCSRVKYAKEGEIEEQMMERINSLLAPSKAITDWVRDTLKERHATDMDAHYATVKQLQQRHVDLQRRIDIAYEDRLDERISTGKYDELVSRYSDEQKSITKQLDNYDDVYLARLEQNLDILELSQRAAEIYDAKKDVAQRRSLLGEIFSNLVLNGDSLDYEYTETVAAIADKAARSDTMIKEFELDKNISTKAKEELDLSIRTIWLGC